MKYLSILLVFLVALLAEASDHRRPAGAALGIDEDGRHYIDCSNDTPKRVSMTITYTKKFATGSTQDLQTTAILKPNEKHQVVAKCALPAPQEEISNVNLKELRTMD
jgi:hypothetical protein